MTTAVIFRRLETRATTADQLILLLKKEISEIKKYCTTKQDSELVQQIKQENKNLSEEIEACKQKLIRCEIQNGKKQIQIPNLKRVNEANGNFTSLAKEIKKEEEVAQPVVSKPNTQVKEVKEKGKKKEKNPAPAKLPERAEDDASRMDLRVGLITSAEKHPNADSLYVEKVDVGVEGEPLTVVSGLAGRIPLEDLQGRLVVLLCNLKPSKMRGVVSQAMVMCASAADGRVETLSPPAGSVPGDKVTVDGQQCDIPPDTQLKKGNFEAIAVKLRTRADLVAGFNGLALVVQGKGPVTTKSLTDVQIK